MSQLNQNTNNLQTILNTINELPTANELVQANWAQTDETQLDFIKNKPDIATKDYVASKVPDGATAHQQLATNSEGNIIWENKICYSEEVHGVVLENTTISYNPDMIFGYITTVPAGQLVEGASYLVRYNGTDYNCQAFKFIYSGVELLGLGNMVFNGGENTGELFALGFVPSEMAAGLGGYVLIYPYDNPETINISIDGISEVIHQIDQKFVPQINSYIINSNNFGSLRTIDSKAEDAEYQMGRSAFASGYNTTASGDHSFVSGYNTTASGDYSFASGAHTTASGDWSHAEGFNTTASGDYSRAEGCNTTASGDYSHAEGYKTTASGNYSHVQGKYNLNDANNLYAHIVGNGSGVTHLSNAHTLDWDGNAWYSGDVYVGSTSGTNRDEGSKKLATEEYVDTKEFDSIILKSENKKFRLTINDKGILSATEIV